MDYVICPRGDYITPSFTPGKRYKVLKADAASFSTTDDNGDKRFCLFDHCAHLALKSWLPGQHKGWDIYYEPRNHIEPWSATSPNYAPDCDEDGFFATPGTYANAKTYEALIAEIDAIVEEQEA